MARLIIFWGQERLFLSQFYKLCWIQSVTSLSICKELTAQSLSCSTISFTALSPLFSPQTSTRLTRLNFLKPDHSYACPLCLFFSCCSLLINIHTQLASYQCLSYSDCEHNLPFSDSRTDFADLANWMPLLLSLQYQMQLPYSVERLTCWRSAFISMVLYEQLSSLSESLPKLLGLII